MTGDGSHSYTYDAENRLTKVDGGSTATYVYDADGKRVQRTVGSTTLNYVYNLNNQVVAEMLSATSANASYAYLGNRMVAQYSSNTTFFLHRDHLGSTRLVTAYPTPTVSDSLDYLPFGEQLAGSSVAAYKFTGLVRDSETTFDHTLFRKYSSQIGRWSTPDPANLAANPSMPQTWNRYAYVLNSPLDFVDTLGLCPGETANGQRDSSPCGSLPTNPGSVNNWPCFGFVGILHPGCPKPRPQPPTESATPNQAGAACVASFTAGGAITGGVVGDVGGGIVGGVVGGVAGGGGGTLVAPGVGTVGGVVVGGTAGAAVGSNVGAAVGALAGSSRHRYMETKIIFEVSTKSFAWQPIWASLGAFIFGCLIVFFNRLNARYAVKIVGCLMILAAVITAGYDSARWHLLRRSHMRILASGHTEVVQGLVESFRPMPDDGSSNESFAISGHTFSYSDYHELETTPCFNQTRRQGGPIRDGMLLQVKFIDNCILEISALPR